MKLTKRQYNLGLLLIIVNSTLAMAQSGGGFTIEQSVIVPGGGTASAGSFVIEGSNAQPTAHPAISNGPFVLTSGFWNPLFVPTAASASISGRVRTAGGNPLAMARVICFDAAGNSRTARTSISGYYQLSDLTVGETYFVYVEMRGYSFESRVVSLVDDLTDLDFVAQ